MDKKGMPKSHPGSSKVDYHDPQQHLHKDICSERIDSGIDSMSLPDDGYGSVSLDSFRQLRISSDPNPPDKTAISDERLDSGLDLQSIQEESEEKSDVTDDEVKQILQWFMPDEEGDTYLQLAVIQKKEDIAFDLIQSCPVPEMLNFANESNQTALHLAVLTDQPQLVRCLVVYGAKLNCKDKDGNTPLHLASQHGLPVHVDMLTAPTNKNERTGYSTHQSTINVNERNYEGYTPLHLAAMHNHVRVMKMLVKKLKCDINTADVKSGRTALHHAIECQNLEASKCLLFYKADVNALTYDECSALHLAAAKGLRRESRMLLEYGADIFLITMDDFDVFELASHNRCLLDTLRDAERQQQGRAATSC